MQRYERWLMHKGSTWHVVREVPRDLRGKVLSKAGKPTTRVVRSVRSLNTAAHTATLSKRHAVLAEFNAILDAARRPGEANQIIQAAMNWRAAMARLRAGDMSRFWTSKEPDYGSTPPEDAGHNAGWHRADCG